MNILLFAFIRDLLMNRKQNFILKICWLGLGRSLRILFYSWNIMPREVNTGLFVGCLDIGTE